MNKKVLLLYDMQDTPLAKDVRDFCEALGISRLELIPLRPNNVSPTLSGKEAAHFKTCDAVIFLVTPRDLKGAISPSVTHELGQATIKFENTPDKVIILADETCVFPVIEQRPRNSFKRDDAASVIRALTLFVEELRHAGLLPGTTPDEDASEQKFSLEKAARTKGLVDALIFMSRCDKTAVSEEALDRALIEKLSLTTQEINFLKDDLNRYGLAQYYRSYWRLMRRGVDLAREAVGKGYSGIKILASTSTMHRQRPDYMR